MHLWRRALQIAVLLLASMIFSTSLLAASAKISKSITPAGDGEYMVKLRVTAIGHSIYCLKLVDQSASITNIYAPKGWCVATDNEEFIGRTMKGAIKPGKTVEFVIYTSSKDVDFAWSVYGVFKQLGKGGKI